MPTVILCPVRNESTALSTLLPEAQSLERQFLFVDDGSVDDSAAILAAWAAARQGVEILSLSPSQGKSAAVVFGLTRISQRVKDRTLDPRDILILLDADGQHPVATVPSLEVSLEDQGVDLLIAFRDLSGYPWRKKFGNRLLSWQASCLTGVLYRDSLCGLRALRCGRAGEIAALLSGWSYTCEQEMCVGLPRRGWKVANNFPISPPHQRSNPTLRDGCLIFLAAFRSWLR